MKFRPCIDIHNGKVKQIVGGSLLDQGNQAIDNFVSEQDASFYGNLYRESNLRGGHIIILNPALSEFYKEDVRQAQLALEAFPNGLQIGGGITADNAKSFLEKGATHVIVTSYVFKDGEIQIERLHKLLEAVGKEHIVLDLSCRKKDGTYFIVTDRWQKFTNVEVTYETLDMLSDYCDEFLIHAVDVEGKASGVETELVKMLGKWSKIPVTYAGGVGSYEDLEQLKKLGNGHVDVTIGSALDLFGGKLDYQHVLALCRETEL
ncbi:phosphoribosylformimino-5-aminoimidazole carboxamide ribotide isomerase [[Clostridium] polysaccharolyticum]|jgi:phosphoribosylformimino-5-aminoimidazole carboxamide ribotide isomerase|uniref:1-(5-phosphoribosyl)-5-[(5-phosphoribosylamino)methylideneamino] imidazole-4-carboxamide isomerase n=1 Tax=[Clostridium] polysaccharolyticum TaxID=29364 RepID=A0A1I0D381_9FIRM|nr:phosphoribosylformimino-5-aminoimidazole carboxamide ribotide isomerase [[Clostridium] polysaccharolyticum]SET26553.1 1-(5-phosphoribosyl)-5-[(5-phosphoribosylamino)methylideneamino] imidazole-4-carboxamide isomerase [[Clostridium] polysaccharolyticum]